MATGLSMYIIVLYVYNYLFRLSRMFVFPFKCYSKYIETFHNGKNELPQRSVGSVVHYELHCSVSCPFLYVGCVHSQLAGMAVASTTEPHLTNRLVPAGGWGRNRHSGRLPSDSAENVDMYKGWTRKMPLQLPFIFGWLIRWFDYRQLHINLSILPYCLWLSAPSSFLPTGNLYIQVKNI